jgi:hypothetical protein
VPLAEYQAFNTCTFGVQEEEVGTSYPNHSQLQIRILEKARIYIMSTLGAFIGYPRLCSQ